MRTLIGAAILVTLALALTGAVSANAGGEKAEKHSCFFHMDAMKDAKYEVTNTADGVMIKITSDKPEVVKQIQESIAKCHEAHKSGDHKGMCPMMKDSTKCPHHREGAEGPRK